MLIEGSGVGLGVRSPILKFKELSTPDFWLFKT
jgi:hypothetical protein